MKHTSFFTVIIVFIILSCSCQNFNDAIDYESDTNGDIELSIEEIASISFTDTTKLNETEIKEILNTHIKNLYTSYSTEVPIIKKMSKAYIDNRISLIYEVEFEFNGYNKALVSGDRRFPYVLASFKLDVHNSEENIDIAPILYAKGLLSNNIHQIEQIKDSLYQKTKLKLEKIFGKDFNSLNDRDLSSLISFNRDSKSRATIITNPPSDAIAGNGPLISVSWNQGMPYNKLMPQSCPENWLWDNRYPISSVVVATAQIFSFFKPSMNVYGNKIDWNYLCEKEEIHDTYDYFGSYTKDPDDKCLMIAQLMKYIGEQCGVSYSCNSSTVYPQKVIDFFKNYNINIDNGQNLDVSKLKASIDELRPVLMYGQDTNGGGHWWVVDGYRTQPATRGTFFPGYNVYMHANMGKGKSYTGYYLVGSDGTLTFDTTFAHFNKNLKMYGNIYH